MLYARSLDDATVIDDNDILWLTGFENVGGKFEKKQWVQNEGRQIVGLLGYRTNVNKHYKIKYKKQ